MTLSGMGEGLQGAASGLAVDIVRAWVLWFLGDQPEHADWECAPPEKARRAPLWAQVFFLLRTVSIRNAGIRTWLLDHCYDFRDVDIRTWLPLRILKSS